MSLIKSISGIRGTIGGRVGENLTPIDIVKFTTAFAILIKEKNPEQSSFTIVVGRDARISGTIVNNMVCSTLQSMGIHVIDLGLSTTPTVEMAVTHLKADGGIILTASHNPMEWNALKLLKSDGEFISGDEGKHLLQIAENENTDYSTATELGSYTKYDQAIQDHIWAIIQLPLVDVAAIKNAGFSVVLDCVNSTGGIALPLLLYALGVNDFKVINGEPTGIFAHNPEPLPEHLEEIASVIKNGKFDVGFVVDPDVDRLAIIDEKGNMFGEEYTLVAVADYVLQHQSGNTVSNLSSTRALRDISLQRGVSYQAAAVGEVNVVEKMKEIGAVIGGEGNGGVIYPELHYGRDALVGIALFLTYLAKSTISCSRLKRQYPAYYMSKNKIALQPQMDVALILNKIAEKYQNEQVNTIDGVKIDFENHWIHLRASNTEPIIRIYTEALTPTVADSSAKMIMEEIEKIVQCLEK
jgi:phosphomannomutase